MEFFNPKSQYQQLKKEIDTAIANVLEKGNYILGQEVKVLENRLADYIGVAHCITVANGTDALLIPLMAWDIGTGDAVFVPSFTFMSTAEVVNFRGATPVFTDIDPDTFNINPDSLEAAIKETIKIGELNPKVIIPVDLFGLSSDYDRIVPIAEKYGLKILEDSAQGFGGSINSKKAGSFGDVATTSFFPSKPLGCYGDGGAIFTNDDELAELCRSIRVHGKGIDKYDNVRIGLNSRLDTIQAAILLPKFKAFKEYELTDRNKWANLYSTLLKEIVKVPFIPDGYESSWAQYTIQSKSKEERDILQFFLKNKGIPTMIYYKKPLHLQGAYSDLGYKLGDFPVSEKMSDCVLSLPMHPYLEEAQVRSICGEIKYFFEKN
jgi:UDP-2-acetamido-2-deoxy-ribo-hexuluronate aminotransferase